MNLNNITTIEEFDGEIMHPSLDIKNNILVLGFPTGLSQMKNKIYF